MTYELRHGNCLDIMPTLRPVQHVITDPPYEAEAHTKGRRMLGTQRNGQRTVEYGALDFDCISEQERTQASSLMVQACTGWLLVFCQAEAVAAWRDAIEAGGGRYMRAMVWIKPDGAPQFTGDQPAMGYESIVAAWCGSGRSHWNGGGAARSVHARAARQQQAQATHDAEADRADARAGGVVYGSWRHGAGPIHGQRNHRCCGCWIGASFHRHRQEIKARCDSHGTN